MSASLPTPVLEARSIGMTFNQGAENEVTAIADMSFSLGKGEVIAIVGPSGCGKTTLFNIISGLLTPTRGQALLSGNEVTRTQGEIGYMLQKDLLLPWRSVLRNVTIGLELRGMSGDEARARAMELINAYGLAGFENQKPKALSGGMRQRVAFMRTLAFNPSVILLDEPFSALDSQTRLMLQTDMLRIIREQECSVLLVTHDIGEAIAMADRIVVITSRPGRVLDTHEVGLSVEERHPLKLRRNAHFTELYETIWRQLGIDEEAA